MCKCDSNNGNAACGTNSHIVIEGTSSWNENFYEENPRSLS